MSSSRNHIDYWIACSGGADSVVLVRLFKELGKSFGILHCNFKLRGNDSDEDENFVRNLAAEINVPLKVKNFDVQKYIKMNGGNTQLAARNLRYEWFDEIKSKLEANIVLGHHKDDQIETFFLQLRRGGKLKGLSGMPKNRANYLRPLLDYTKGEIYNLAKINSWFWREDVSNKKSDYLRNLYRNELIPAFEDIESIKNQAIDLIEGFQSLLLLTEQYLTDQYDFSKELKVSFAKWDLMPYWMKHILLSKSELFPISVKEVERLRTSEKGKSLKTQSKAIWNEGDGFLIVNSSDKTLDFNCEIDLIRVEEVIFEEGIVFIDKDKVKGALSIRKWEKGESFYPLGMLEQKKVSKFLRDRKVDSSKKRSHFVIVDDSNQIVGVLKMCPDNRFKIDEDSSWAYRVKYLS